jgi:hypothetical protein
MMPKPVCVKCRCFYRPKQNGFAWIEGKPHGGAVRVERDENVRGLRCPDAWTPYKLWNSDLWACPDCGHEIVVGHGAGPIAEHYEDRFAAEVARHGAELQVNDC